MSFQVKGENIRYSNLMFFLIFNKTTGEFHNGGVIFRGTDHSQNAKWYKSATVAESTINNFKLHTCTKDDEFVVMRYVAKPQLIEKEM